MLIFSEVTYRPEQEFRQQGKRGRGGIFARMKAMDEIFSARGGNPG